jgi:hypothetical protein
MKNLNVNQMENLEAGGKCGWFAVGLLVGITAATTIVGAGWGYGVATGSVVQAGANGCFNF